MRAPVAAWNEAISPQSTRTCALPSVLRLPSTSTGTAASPMMTKLLYRFRAFIVCDPFSTLFGHARPLETWLVGVSGRTELRRSLQGLGTSGILFVTPFMAGLAWVAPASKRIEVLRRCRVFYVPPC